MEIVNESEVDSDGLWMEIRNDPHIVDSELSNILSGDFNTAGAMQIVSRTRFQARIQKYIHEMIASDTKQDYQVFMKYMFAAKNCLRISVYKELKCFP